MPNFVADISCRCPADPYKPAQNAWYVDGSLDGVPEVVLLVHGYNDHESYADCAYEYFRNLCVSLSVTTLKISFAKVQWPGDQRNPLAGAVEYAQAVEHAKQSASALAPLLQGWASSVPGGPRLHWVAHSLGNRVTLETIRILQASGTSIRLSTLAMLASAVEVDHVQPGAILHDAATVSDCTIVLHSTGDPVLHWAFPPGQWMAGEGFMREAVGRNGDPAGMWARQQAFNWFGHSNYWFDTQAVDFTLRNMGVPTNRTTPRNDSQSGILPEANVTPTASTPVRQTPTAASPYSASSKFSNPC